MQHTPPTPSINITPGRLVFYSSYDNSSYKKVQRLCGSEVRKANNQLLSYDQQKRLKQAINTLAYIAKWKTVYQKETNKSFRFKLSFITLTLPSLQIHNDKYCVMKILSPFLESWKKMNPSMLYVWKAEVQDNGNIHFHITTNVFIHYMKLRERWNKSLSKHGYLKRNEVKDVNSTDVHCIKNIKNIAAYLTSYISKKDLYKRPLKRYHRIYGKLLLESKKTVFHLPKDYFNQLKRKVECSIYSCSKPLLNAKVNVHAEEKGILGAVDFIDNHSTKSVVLDYCSLLYCDHDVMKRCKIIDNLYTSMMNARFKEYSENSKMYYTI